MNNWQLTGIYLVGFVWTFRYVFSYMRTSNHITWNGMSGDDYFMIITMSTAITLFWPIVLPSLHLFHLGRFVFRSLGDRPKVWLKWYLTIDRTERKELLRR